MQLQMLRACDVCRLVDLDPSPKLCVLCPLCDAWLCTGCSGWTPKQLLRRAEAAAKRLLEPGSHGSPDYVKELAKAAEQANHGKGA